MPLRIVLVCYSSQLTNMGPAHMHVFPSRLTDNHCVTGLVPAESWPQHLLHCKDSVIQAPSSVLPPASVCFSITHLTSLEDEYLLHIPASFTELVPSLTDFLIPNNKEILEKCRERKRESLGPIANLLTPPRCELNQE